MLTSRFYLRLLKRWFWLLILAPVVAGALSYQLNADTEVYYEARALIMVGPGVDNPNPSLDDLRTAGMLLETYATIAMTRPFLEQVIDTLDLENYSPGKLENRMDIVTNKNAQTMSIRVQELDRTEAMLLANTVATMLVNLSPSGLSSIRLDYQSQVESQINSLKASIESSDLLIEQLQQDLEAATTEGDRLRYIEQISAERARIAGTERTVASLYESLQEPLSNQVRVIEPAVQGKRIDPQIELRATMSSIGGLVIAVALAFAVEYMDDRIRTTHDLAEASRLPVLGTLTDSQREPVTLDRLEAGQRKTKVTPTDSYQILSFKLRALKKRVEGKSILMTGLPGAQNVDMHIINTAIALAQTGTKVTLVDADLENPAISDFFAATGAQGLTDALSDATLTSLPPMTEVFPELKVVPVGQNVAGGLALLCSSQMAQLVKRLEEDEATDLVVVGVATQDAHVESLALGNLVSGTVLLAARGHSRRKHIVERITEAEALGVHMIGAILTEPPLLDGGNVLRRLRARALRLYTGRLGRVRGLVTETQDVRQLSQ